MPQGVDLKPVAGAFRFACHAGLTCFTACCARLDLILTPYDVLRLKRALGIKAGVFLEEHAVPVEERRARWPLIRLKMSGPEGRCPFLSSQGCNVYLDRPSACRSYPLARATRPGFVPGEIQEQYFLVEEEHCRGFQEERTWMVGDWVADQGLLEYHPFNDRWMTIRTHPKGPGAGPEAEKKKQMFYLASYDLDRFRDFVFQTRFSRLFELEAGRLERTRTEDEALLSLALDWLEFCLLGQGPLRIRSEDGQPG